MHFSYFCLSLMFISLFCVCLFYGLVPELNVLIDWLTGEGPLNGVCVCVFMPQSVGVNHFQFHYYHCHDIASYVVLLYYRSTLSCSTCCVGSCRYRSGSSPPSLAVCCRSSRSCMRTHQSVMFTDITQSEERLHFHFSVVSGKTCSLYR